MLAKIYDVIRHNDNRGWLAEILREDILKHKIAQIYISYSKKNSIRGGHYHKRKIEWFYVISGKARVFLRKFDETIEETFEISDEDQKVIEIPPFVYHRLKVLTEEMLLLAGSSEVYNKDDPDTFG